MALITLSLAPLIPALDLFGASAFFLSSIPAATFVHDLRENLVPPPPPMPRSGEMALPPVRAVRDDRTCLFGFWGQCDGSDVEGSNQEVLAIATEMKRMGFSAKSHVDLRVFAEAVLEAERLYGVPHEVLIAVAATESAFNPMAISPKNARGLFQIMPNTASFLWPGFVKTLSADDPVLNLEPLSDLHDPRLSTLLGAYYLRHLANHFQGRMHLALASYNAGPAAVQRALATGQIISSEYVYKVSAITQDYRERRASGDRERRTRRDGRPAKARSATTKSSLGRGRNS